MQGPILAKQSVSAETSEFFRAELAAFMTMKRRLRPRAWARVEELKRACWRESPVTAEASPRPEWVLGARAIVQAGIATLHTLAPDFADPLWGPAFRRSRAILEEGGVRAANLDRDPGQMHALTLGA